MTMDEKKMDSVSEVSGDEEIIATDEEVLKLSEKIIAQNKEAYEVLAK